jgi:hypothetical protein
MTVVFDFDKTLTYKDTVFRFFLFCSKRDPILWMKILLYGILMVAHKISFVSNDSLKQMGVYFFLRGKSRNFITNCGEIYASRINLSRIYHDELKKYENPYIASASFGEYLVPILPGTNIIASQLEYNRNRVHRLKMNCYGETKLRMLKDRGVETIDLLYTDSISDLPLVKLSKKTYYVRGNDMIECASVEEFCALAGK